MAWTHDFHKARCKYRQNRSPGKKRLPLFFEYTIIHDICHVFISFSLTIYDAYSKAPATSDEPFT